MVVVRSFSSITLYHTQRVALFWHGMMTQQSSGVGLEPRPSSLVLLHTNLKSAVGQYRDKGPGLKRGRRMKCLMVARVPYERSKGAAEGQ